MRIQSRYARGLGVLGLVIVYGCAGAGAHPQTECRVGCASESDDKAPPAAYEGPERATRRGWVSGPWVATDTLTARVQRSAGAPVAFRLVPGDRVDVDTAVTVTTRAGQVRFNRPAILGKAQPPLHVSAGDTIHVLAYLGEGFATVWFKGRVVRDADLNGICAPGTSGCRGEELSSPETEWWLRIRTSAGQTGWTRDEAKFRKNAWRQRS